MKQIFIRVLLVTALIFPSALYLNSCSHNDKNIDPFYTNRGGWDDAELPVLKPYYLIQLNGRESWGMSLKAESMLDSVTQINVVKDIILVRSLKTYYHSQGKPTEVWAIVIPSKSIQKEFLTRAEFSKNLGELGFNNIPEMYYVEEVARYARHHDVINWTKIRSHN